MKTHVAVADLVTRATALAEEWAGPALSPRLLDERGKPNDFMGALLVAAGLNGRLANEHPVLRDALGRHLCLGVASSHLLSINYIGEADQEGPSNLQGTLPAYFFVQTLERTLERQRKRDLPLAVRKAASRTYEAMGKQPESLRFNWED